MKAKFAVLTLGLCVAGLLAAAVTPADAACVTRRGKGWGWSEGIARFQAWEIVSQKYGNWPLPDTNFRNERYKCKPDGSGYVCLSWIDVCK